MPYRCPACTRTYESRHYQCSCGSTAGFVYYEEKKPPTGNDAKKGKSSVFGWIVVVGFLLFLFSIYADK